MKLNRNNYEEYFILYLDNELESEDRRLVESFVQENPDLKAELDILLQSKFIPDADITFNNKELLMIRNSSSISLSNHEEWLLSYIDNELKDEERKDVERFAAGNPDVQLKLNLLQQVKLQPEAIVFPDKESLYRTEEKVRVVSIRWWRIAAAAVLLIGISATAIVLLNKKDKDSGEIVKVQPKEEKSTNDPAVKQPGNDTPVIAATDSKKDEPVKGKLAVKHNSKREAKEEQPVLVKKEEPVFVKTKEEKPPTKDLARPENNPYAGQSDKLIATVETGTNETLTSTDKKTDSPNVTSSDPDTYHNQEKATGNPDIKFASDNSSQKGGLRGFFRKVTRTFEKKTNIKATDDDDRLLIAGLSIKM